MVIRIITMKNIIFYLGLLCSTLVSFTSTAEQEVPTFSDAQLAQMLAPIALYPDSLLTHILIASTYPIEVVEAHRWLKKNNKLNAEQKKLLLEDFDWDASVKALIPFERVLSRLSEDLSWTQALGDAFLQDESRLLLSIQALRKQAQLAGSLNKMDNMDIDYQDNNISIESREKDIVYVPYYDSRMVYGSWFWSAYPPVYWHPHHSAYVSHYRPFYWHSGVHITFNYFFSAFHWHNRHVVVVNPHRTHHRYYHQRPRRLIANGGYAKRWYHQPSHRKGVAYRTKRTSEKYYGLRASIHSTHKQLNASHHNVKQRLHTSNYSQRKVNHKAVHKVNHKTNYKVKQHNLKSRQVSKHSALQQKDRGTSVRQHKQNRHISERTRKQKPNKRIASPARKNQHQVVKASSHKASSHKGASTRRYHSNITKERK
ncbi:MAG: DUF3300 domain-containing protein [Colwellia sp.]|nr:DUF3300 domain-containing protein [Colwellia sp.]